MLDRDYLLNVLFQDGTEFNITDLRINFNIIKSCFVGNNTATINVFNLSRDKTNKLFREREDNNNNISITLTINKIIIFIGNIYYAHTQRSQADLITAINGVSLLSDVTSTFITKTVDKEPIKSTTDEMDIEKGELIEAKNKRPVVLVGKPVDIVSDYLNKGDLICVEDGKFNITNKESRGKAREVIKIGTEHLLNTPIREASKLTFRVLITPIIKIGKIVNIQSRQEQINGLYNCYQINYIGDNYSNDWYQDTTGFLQQ